MVSLAVVFSLFGAFGAYGDDLSPAREALKRAMAEVGMVKNDTGFLLLTNAFYGQVNSRGAERYRDLLSETTGCTIGKHSLLDVHTPFNEPLWFGLFRKSTNRLVFTKWHDGGFRSQIVDINPETILKVESWKRASSGLIGKKNLFQIVSISLSWSADAVWPIMKAASFHDHLCPGVNVGFLIHKYLTTNLPLEKGEKYVFFGALPKCYMDTLQVLYDATLGKQTAYGITMTKDRLGTYKVNGVVPCVIALKVNKGKNTCQGIVFGFSWKRIFDDLGIKISDFAPKKGPADPVFFVTRAKASWKMAQMKLEDKMRWVEALKTFSGDANLVSRVCNAGGDPYAVVWAK